MYIWIDFGVRRRAQGGKRDKQVIQIKTNGDDVGENESFKYLGFVLHKSGGFEEYIKHI